MMTCVCVLCRGNSRTQKAMRVRDGVEESDGDEARLQGEDDVSKEVLRQAEHWDRRARWRDESDGDDAGAP